MKNKWFIVPFFCWYRRARCSADAQYVVRQWNIEHGLPQSSIRCITRTHDGYLWIGTWNGLARFDGVRMTVFNALNTPDFHPSVSAIYEDSQHRFWIGTDGGGLFQYRDGALVRLDSVDGIVATMINSIAEDLEGRVWFGTNNGVFVHTAGRFLHFGARIGFPELATHVIPAPDGSVYVQFVGPVYRNVADLNADGKPEIVLWHSVQEENTISILQNTMLSYSLSQSTVSLSSSTVQSGSSVTVTLTLKDNNGLVTGIGGPTVVFSLSGGGTSTGSFSIPNQSFGVYTATFRGVAAGTARTVSATIGGRAVTSTLPTIAVTPGPVSLTETILSLPSPILLKDQTTSVTLRARDANGNLLTTGGLSVAFGASGGTSEVSFGPTIDHNNGTYTATMTGTVVGTEKVIFGTISGSTLTSIRFITVQPNVPSPAHSVITISSSSIRSATTATVTLQAKNIFGTNLVAGGATVAFSLAGTGASSGTFGPVTDRNDGTYTVVLTGITAGTPREITATINGNPVTTTLPAFTVTSADYLFIHSTLTVDPLPFSSGTSSVVKFQAKDLNGNNVPQTGLSVSFSLSPPGPGSGYSTGELGTVSYAGDGAYTAPLKGLVAGGAINLTVSANSNIKSTLVTVAPGAASLLQSVAAVALPSVPSGLATRVYGRFVPMRQYTLKLERQIFIRKNHDETWRLVLH